MDNRVKTLIDGLKMPSQCLIESIRVRLTDRSEVDSLLDAESYKQVLAEQ